MKDTIILKSGKWVAGVCPRLGGNLIYLLYNAKNILRPLVDESQLDVDPYLQGSPILLPANRTFEGKFSFEGKDYSLPVNEPRTNSHLHGLVHRQPFSIVSQSEKSVTLKFVNRDGLVYPFDFEIIATYTIDDDGLSQSFELKNIGKVNMPYTFCLHTSFAMPYGNLTFPVKAKQETINGVAANLYRELNEGEKELVAGRTGRDILMDGCYLAEGHTLRVGNFSYTVSENFDHWVTWNPFGKEDYVCLEPQAGQVNGLNLPNGCKILAPEQRELYTTRFSLA